MSAARPPPANFNVENIAQAGIKRPKHPEWFPVKPTPTTRRTGLKVLNSLTEELEEFVPRNGNIVKWYTCGPTVYDMSHMGHARAYLTFDILRRIMEDYFGYTVLYQMNITDIDDKIIRRARIGKLLADFKNADPTFEVIDEAVTRALAAKDASLKKRREQLSVPLAADAPGRIRDEREEKVKELELKESQYAEGLAKIKLARAANNKPALLSAGEPFLGDLFDDEKGATVNDQGIFDAHSRKYEQEFFTDMHRLGVRDPDVLSRVTEVVPQVVDFTQRIIDNGFAYVGQTSVFFDTEAYQAAGHDYPKLKPTTGKTATTEDEMAEGEGALARGEKGEKKHPNDFALWKFSKAGEPSWPSPWGPGRPGWHIECSVMASEVLGDNMDVHGGGCDLKFPHHDNEIAQSEAFWGHAQWVNYFLHCGHLHIKGLKMSKSLKNFITIRQALDELNVSPRTMRLLFLAFPWTAPMNFSDQTLGAAQNTERVLRNFFGSLDALFRDRDAHLKEPQGFTPADKTLTDALLAMETTVHEKLCDNFNTPEALIAIMDLVKIANAYLLDSSTRKNQMLLRRVGRSITRFFQIFGVVDGTDGIGFMEKSSSSATDDERFNTVTDALVTFRDAVRSCVKSGQPSATLMPLSDRLRDELLLPAGVRLEDRPDGPTQWKRDDPAILLAELAEKKARAEAERAKKLTNTLETKRKLLEKWRGFSTHPMHYFKGDPVEAVKYTEYDAAGLPTKDAAGVALDEKKQKKLKKDQEKYEQSYQELQTKGGESFLAELAADIAALKTALGSTSPEPQGAARPSAAAASA